MEVLVSLEEDALEALRRKREADAAAAEVARKRAEMQSAMLRDFIELAGKYGAPTQRFSKSGQAPVARAPIDFSGLDGWVITRPSSVGIASKTVEYGVAVTTDGKLFKYKDGPFGPALVETWGVLGIIEVSRDDLIAAAMKIIENAERRNE
jgi:hypothetical protein